MWAVRSTCENDQNGTSLSHYGVKGMKWGVRKEYETKGIRTGKVKDSSKPDYKNSNQYGDTLIHFVNKDDRKSEGDFIEYIYPISYQIDMLLKKKLKKS